MSLMEPSSDNAGGSLRDDLRRADTLVISIDTVVNTVKRFHTVFTNSCPLVCWFQ